MKLLPPSSSSLLLLLLLVVVIITASSSLIRNSSTESTSHSTPTSRSKFSTTKTSHVINLSRVDDISTHPTIHPSINYSSRSIHKPINNDLSDGNSTPFEKVSNLSFHPCRGHNLSSHTLPRGSNGSSSGRSCPHEGDLTMRILGALISYLLLVSGTVGNLCVIAVVMRTKSLRRHPTNWYLASVALADFIILWSAAFPTILEFQTAVGEWVYGGSLGCSVAVFFQYLGFNVSSIFIMAFSLERYVAICHPMRAMVMCTVSRAKRIVTMVWLFGLVYCAPWFFVTTTKSRCRPGTPGLESNSTPKVQLQQCTTPSNHSVVNHHYRESVECIFKLQRSHYTIYYMADFIMFYVLPLVSTCILYILIAKTIRFNKELKRPSLISAERKQKRELQPRCNKGPTYAASRVQVVKMLAVVVAVFAILWLPYRLFVVYNSFAKVRFESLWYLTFCRLSIYCNSAINPVLYNLMSAKFRKAFYQLFLCSRFSDRTAQKRHMRVTNSANATSSHVL